MATRVGDIPEILDDTCGVLVRPEDADGLAAAVCRVARDDSLRERLGRAARERILERGLTLDSSLRAYEKCYAEL